MRVAIQSESSKREFFREETGTRWYLMSGNGVVVSVKKTGPDKRVWPNEFVLQSPTKTGLKKQLLKKVEILARRARKNGKAVVSIREEHSFENVLSKSGKTLSCSVQLGFVVGDFAPESNVPWIPDDVQMGRTLWKKLDREEIVEELLAS